MNSNESGAREEAQALQKELMEVQRGREMLFSPFLRLRVPVEKLCSLDDFEKHGLDVGSQCEIPEMKWPKAPRIQTGVTLKTMNLDGTTVKYVHGPAYLSVDRHGRYIFTNSANETITYSCYHPDSAFNTETKFNTCILGMLEAWIQNLNSNYYNFLVDLKDWCMKRWRVEMDLFKRMYDMELITLSAEEVMRLSVDSMVYRKFYYERIFGAEDSLVGLLTGRSTEIVVNELLDDLFHSAWCIRARLKEVRPSIPPKEHLLVCFDDEDEPEVPQKASSPTPGHHKMQQFYDWCLERHANWAKEGVFTKRTCHHRYQLGTLADLTTAASIYWPQGNRGLIPEKVRYDKQLQAYPWGLPASKLTTTLKEAGREEVYSNVYVREYLRDLELWYFEQNSKTSKSLLDLGLQKWPRPAHLVNTLKGFLDTGHGSDMEME